MPFLKPRDVTFLELRDAVLCVDCELISYNNSPKCLACGSEAVLSLSRTLGSLRNSETARCITPDDVVRVAGEVLHPPMGDPPDKPWIMPPASDILPGPVIAPPAPLMCRAVERVAKLPGCTGAALALWEDGKLRCRARAGHTAPGVGATVGEKGLTALVARTGEPWICEDSEQHPFVNRTACRRMGVRSIIAAPVTSGLDVRGILEVFSSEAYVFTQREVTAVQLVAGIVAVALERQSGRRTLRGSPASNTAS